MAKDYIGFTIDLRTFISVMAQDPTCKDEIIAGLNGAKEPITSQLGASNIGTKEAPLWASLFPATVEGKNPGEEGLFYRNNSQGGKGDRVQMRLKRQTTQANKPAPAQTQYQLATPAQAMPQGAGAATASAAVAALQSANPVLFAQLLATVAAQQGNAQLNATVQSQQAVQVPQVQQEVGPVIPADIAEILNRAG